MMEQPVVQIKYAAREILGDIPSPIFMGRIERTLDEGVANMDSLCQACTKVEKMVHLFIGVETSKVVGQRFREILENVI